MIFEYEYKSFWTRAFDFKGRSSRSDYWKAVFANFIIYFVLLMLVEWNVAFANLFSSYALLQLVPSLSIQIRRVRDMGKSWQWIFITLIPVIGAFWWLYFLVQPSLTVG